MTPTTSPALLTAAEPEDPPIRSFVDAKLSGCFKLSSARAASQLSGSLYGAVSVATSNTPPIVVNGSMNVPPPR